MKSNKRKIIRLISAVLTLILFLLSGCDNSGLTTDKGGLIFHAEGKACSETVLTNENLKECQVDFIDVGEGDSIFISLPDGKCVLIDTGRDDDALAKKIKEHILDKGFSTINYLILTHPDADHVGNANFIIDNFTIQQAFVPDLPSLKIFPLFESILNNLQDKNVNVSVSKKLMTILGENYGFTFLSPSDRYAPNGEYSEFDPFNPTDKDINNVSATIYFECYGVKFLFMGDAGAEVEQKIIDSYDSNFYKYLSVINDDVKNDKYDVDLTNIDFLKVSHHGAQDGTSESFLLKTCPKNAIISVGGNNVYGHPHSSVLSRINELAPNCKTWRTDILGSLMVFVCGDASYKLYSKK